MLSIVRRSALIPAACLVLLCGGVRAADLHVPGDHPDVQSAIDAAQFGDVIHVGPGTWHGPLVVVGKSITIEGAGAEVTVLHGLGAERTLYVTSLPGGSADVTLRNVTVTGGLDGAKADLPDTLKLYNCVVRDNAGVGAVGLDFAIDSAFLDNGSHGLSDFNVANGCTFQGNGGWGAIDVDGSPAEKQASTVFRCQFLGNGLGGLRLFWGSASPGLESVVQLRYCIFRNDKAQISALKYDGTGEVQVRRCSFLNSTLKIMQGNLDMDTTIMRGPAPIVFLIGQPDKEVTYSNVEGGWALPFDPSNIDADPLWADPVAGDFSLLPGSPCINTGSAEGIVDYDDFSPSDMGAVTYDAWTDLGGGIAGSAVFAELWGTGSLIAGKEVRLSLFSGMPGSAALLVIGTDALGAPFKGGVLWPQPDVIIGPYHVHFGSFLLLLEGDWPAGLPSGFSFWSQVWWTDAAAPQGLAATNGLRATQP